MQNTPSLKEITSQLQKVYPQLNWVSESVQINGTTFYNVSNLNLLRNGIIELEKMGLFKNLVESLVESVIFTTGNDSLRIQSIENNGISNNIKLLKTLIENFLDVLHQTVPEESLQSINIKMPPVNDFDDLSKVSREIHLAITQVVYLPEIGGQTKIESVENGSIWFNVLVGSAAVSVIASMVWSAAVIFKKIMEGKLLAEQIRGLKVKNESLEDILKAQKAETEMMLQAEAKFVYSEHFKNDTPENIEKIKNSISTFADLISKGAEIKPALMAPEEVSNLFPDATKLISLESRIKKLAN
ncbi:hypothetical protein [Flavobacterium turcicum]|uniref:Uncharacterized protein n=1 Tax=Flavobacterium turcicum TaxID=2764718 RepID=A0ABR7JIW9_9FLAO|nr:hypothetical protein [Flavobacterium turcicum]MBC5864441.1 hypothetical protein [Flavobacterium turcicum]NHL03209.1 hypothetical protein [Flavobacterium turcicum]